MKTITLAEAHAIDRIAKLCEFHRRGVIDAGEAVTSMLHDLSHCQSEFAAEQCVARLPQEFHSELVRQVKHWLSLEHPGNLFVFVPNIPTDDELLEMDKRFRLFGTSILAYLGNPTVQRTCRQHDAKTRI